jgi:hypothetical protein
MHTLSRFSVKQGINMKEGRKVRQREFGTVDDVGAISNHQS